MTRKPLPLVAVTTVALTLSLTARGETPAAFGRRCIPAGCVAPRSNTPGILARRALPSGRIAALGATLDFHHGLLSFRSRHRRCAHALPELWLDFIQEFPLPILFGDGRNGQRPGQAETRIAVAKASFSAGCVELTDLIAGIGVVSKGLIAVREPFRHVQRAIVVLGELHRDMLQVSGAFRAKVDDDVDDRTTGAANELALGCGWTLEVHSSQRPLQP